MTSPFLALVLLLAVSASTTFVEARSSSTSLPQSITEDQMAGSSSTLKELKVQNIELLKQQNYLAKDITAMQNIIAQLSSLPSKTEMQARNLQHLQNDVTMKTQQYQQAASAAEESIVKMAKARIVLDKDTVDPKFRAYVIHQAHLDAPLPAPKPLKNLAQPPQHVPSTAGSFAKVQTPANIPPQQVPSTAESFAKVQTPDWLNQIWVRVKKAVMGLADASKKALTWIP